MMKNKFIMIVRIGLVIALINLLLAIATPLSRIYLDTAPMKVFPIFIQAIRFGLLLAACGLLFTVVSTFMKNIPAVKSAIAMMLLGILPMGMVIATIGPERFSSPMIHDITTDMETPPEFNKARGLRQPGENSMDYSGEAIATQQRSAYPDVKPIYSSLNRDEAFSRVLKVARSLDWTLINVDSENAIVEAYNTTRFFGFTDDIIIRIQPDGDGSRVDIRSISRVGLSDAGMNATRIRKFVKAFNQ